MATNRPTTRRKSTKHAFEEDDAPPAKRPRTELNGTGTGRRTNGATRKATKTAYDEDDDGFQFTRRTSRRTAAKALPTPEPAPEQPLQPVPSRRKKDPSTALEPKQSETQRRRRSARLSGDKEQLEPKPEEAQPMKRTKKSAPVERKKQITPAPESVPELAGKSASVGVGVQTPKQSELVGTKQRDGGATKIMLPFADTPVITRNKEMRKGPKKGHRRSSTGLRGRRASSLMDSGLSNALPHSEVEVRDFYKYIEQNLAEPRRMKQLLTWCGSRALPEKPSGNVKDSNAIMSARAIQQELIEDFANKPELSDWFSREDTAPTTVVKKPNPQNTSMQAALEELEEEIKRLEEEKAAWDTLTSAPTLAHPPPLPTIHTTIPSLADIDTSLLDPSQASILAALQPPQPSQSSSDVQTPSAFTFTTPSALQTHISKLSLALEPTVDIFADGVHKIEQYRITAERVASKVLGSAAQRLEQRDREGKEKVGSEGIGVGDVLRSLAGVLNDS